MQRNDRPSPEWLRQKYEGEMLDCSQIGRHLDYRTVDRKTAKFHIHHIVSFAITESRADPTNLLLLCSPCHMLTHREERAAAREAVA